MAIRIFIADDHAVFRSGLRALLEKEADFDIVGETGSGAEVLAAVASNSVDLILLDISMPGISGPKVATEALNQRPGLAVVMLTMHEDEYYLQELLRIGVRGYVLKKSTGTELVQAIRAAYRGDTYVDPAMARHMISNYVGRTPAEIQDPLSLLTLREREVCQFLAYGHTNAEIAEKLFLSDRTVETHRNRVMHKLGLKTRAELVRFAIDNGLLKMD